MRESAVKTTLYLEMNKTIRNKDIFLLWLLFFIVFFSIVLIYAFSFPLHEKEELSNEDKVVLRVEYIEQREFYKQILDYLDGQSGDLPDGVIIVPNYDYEKEYLYYDFLIENNTFSVDYLTTHQQTFDLSHQGSYVMVVVFKALSLVLPILAITLAFEVFNLDINDSLKNILISSNNRKNVFFGKNVFLYLISTLYLLLTMVIPFIMGWSDSAAKFLLYGEDGFFEKSALEIVFLPKFVTIILSMLFWMNFAKLTMLIKNRKMSISLTVITYFVTRSIFYIANSIGVSNKILFGLFSLFYLQAGELYEYLDVFSYFTKGWLTLIIVTVIEIALTIIVDYLCRKKILKKDVISVDCN